MTEVTVRASADLDEAHAAGRTTVAAASLMRKPVAFVASGVVLLELAVADRYGYNVDELYYRLLGRHGAVWGYVDQPPLVPLVAGAVAGLTRDSLWGFRVPAALCAGLVCVLVALMAAELGGRRSQVVAAAGIGTSVIVLSVGHVFVTTTVDLLATGAFWVCALRALLRGDGRWWLAAGIVVGGATYAKYVALLAPVALLVALALVGPRRVLREPALWRGAALALLVASPNLVYQLTHGLPQVQMARALAATDGPVNRVLLVPAQALLLGPVLTVVLVRGIAALMRSDAWYPARAVAVAYPLALVLVLAGSGRPDYAAGMLLPLFAAGVVRMGQGSRRPTVAAGGALAAVLAVGVAAQVLVALPVLPVRSLAAVSLNDISLQSVGWPQLADQVSRAYDGLPERERQRAVVIAWTIGEAGALDRYGRSLPSVYSGHNELGRWGPPPETADVVVAVGVEPDLLQRGFTSCRVVGRVDNGLGIENAEQGRPVRVCRGRTASWAQLWPAYLYLSG